jgi:hypothetical protein
MRLQAGIGWPFAALTLVLASWSCQGTGCSPWELCIQTGEITYTNETDERLFAHFNWEGASHLLRPGDTRTISFVLPQPRGDQRYDDEDDPVMINFYDSYGCDALTITTTVREIREKHESSFVITSGDLAPREDRHDCDSGRLPVFFN